MTDISIINTLKVLKKSWILPSNKLRKIKKLRKSPKKYHKGNKEAIHIFGGWEGPIHSKSRCYIVMEIGWDCIQKVWKIFSY